MSGSVPLPVRRRRARQALRRAPRNRCAGRRDLHRRTRRAGRRRRRAAAAREDLPAREVQRRALDRAAEPGCPGSTAPITQLPLLAATSGGARNRTGVQESIETSSSRACSPCPRRLSQPAACLFRLAPGIPALRLALVVDVLFATRTISREPGVHATCLRSGNAMWLSFADNGCSLEWGERHCTQTFSLLPCRKPVHPRVLEAYHAAGGGGGGGFTIAVFERLFR